MFNHDDGIPGDIFDSPDDPFQQNPGADHLTANDAISPNLDSFHLEDLNFLENAQIQSFDSDNDGRLDTGCIDTDSDGLVDIIQHDSNANGTIDIVGMDSNHDGNMDIIYVSSNDDGYFDHELIDTTGSGQFDTMISDTNDDHRYDTIEHLEFFDPAADPNAGGYDPGQIDNYDPNAGGYDPGQIDYYDPSHTGNYDPSHTVDTEPGHADNGTGGHDLDGDRTLSYIEEHTDNTHIGRDPYYDVGNNMMVPAQFDINSGTDGVVGDPADDMSVWHMQTHEDTCAVVSQEFVLEDLTGREFHEDELMRIAEEHGWYTPGGGTSPENVGNLLEYFGLHVERGNGDIHTIQDALANGDKVIVGVDADELWHNGVDPNHPLDSTMGIPENDANHAVEVIGIDHSDPDHPMVILNDPGSPAGQGSMIPLDLFEQSWADSGNYVVIASN